MHSGSIAIQPKRAQWFDFQSVEASLRSAYRQAHIQYRRDDDLEVATANHRRLAGILESICSSFGRRISVLDAGCGTGRYFHCLKDVARLVGIDLSPEMLRAAKTPVRQQEISAEKIELVCGNIHGVSFPPRSFDFIYSLGMFGHGCPLTVELCDKFYDWLATGGELFFNTLDVRTFPVATRLRKRVRRVIWPLLPRRCRQILQTRGGGLPFFGLTKRSLEATLNASPFGEFDVCRHACRSPLWRGVHLECRASK